MIMDDYDQGFRDGWNAAIRRAAQTAETSHERWHGTEGHGVSCDVTACEEIATAIRALKDK
jgi:hypothetical protein